MGTPFAAHSQNGMIYCPVAFPYDQGCCPAVAANCGGAWHVCSASVMTLVFWGGGRNLASL